MLHFRLNPCRHTLYPDIARAVFATVLALALPWTAVEADPARPQSSDACISWYLHNSLVSLPLIPGGCLPPPGSAHDTRSPAATSRRTQPPQPGNRSSYQDLLTRLDEQLAGNGPFRFFPTPFDHDIEALSRQFGVDPLLVKSIIYIESGFNHQARSHKGAQGLMQLMPATARRFGADASLPTSNLRAGIRYLRQLLDRYGRAGKNPAASTGGKSTSSPTALALAAYNAGESAVSRYNGIPPYRETQDYVARVTRLYKQACLARNTSDIQTTASTITPHPVRLSYP